VGAPMVESGDDVVVNIVVGDGDGGNVGVKVGVVGGFFLLIAA